MPCFFVTIQRRVRDLKASVPRFEPPISLWYRKKTTPFGIVLILMVGEGYALLSVFCFPVFGATPPVICCTYALAKNAMLWRFCLRRAHSLRLDTLAFESTLSHFSKKDDTFRYRLHSYGGRGWIRTTEVTDNRFTVCPLWPLGNSPTLWSWWTDSNPRPADYKSAALPTELHQHFFVLSYNIISSNFCQQFFIEIIKNSSYINVFRSNRQAYQVICNVGF